MKLSLIVIVLLGFGFFGSCMSTSKTLIQEDTIRNKNEHVCNPIIKSDNLPESIKTDFFEIESMFIEKNCLKLDVSYGGGCGETDMQMFYQKIEASVVPANLLLMPKFTDNDPCRAIIRDTILFDLSEFEGVARSGGVTIHLQGFNNKVVFALPLH